MLDVSRMMMPQSTTIATTNNWDTVFALDFKAVNDGIAGQGRFPATFQHPENPQPTDAQISGDFSDWRLTGGAGHILEMKMTIPTLTISMPSETAQTRTNAEVTIQMSLQTVMGEEGSGIGGGTPVSFRTHRRSDLLANAGNYVITVTDLTWPNSGSEPDLATDGRILMAQYFARGDIHDEFDHTFATVNLNSRLVQKDADFSWIAPTDTSYGVIANEAMGGGTFAVLCMIKGHEAPDHHNVSPAILADKRAGFLLNKSVFLDNMVKPGLAVMFDRDPDDEAWVNANFVVDSDAITNRNELTLPSFTVMKSKDNPEEVEAKIPARSFNISLLDTRLVINLNGLHHPYYKFIDYFYEAYHYYTIQTHATFVPATKSFGLEPVKVGEEDIISYRASLEKSGFGKAVDITLLVVDILSVVAAVLKAWKVAKGVEAAANTVEAADAATNAATLTDRMRTLKAVITSQPAFLYASIAASAFGIGWGLYNNWWENTREDDPTNIKPDMQAFATSVLAPVQWPAGAGLSVENVAFNGGFHITGTPDFSEA